MARHKRGKFGCLPGDISKGKKIAMLEKDIDGNCAKTYRQDHQEKVERRFRHAAAKEIKERLE